MPHFSFWSWPLPFIGTLDQALAKINRVEKETPWEKKIDKVVWRGTAWFNSAGNTALRPNLLQVTKKKEWADVENLEWENNGQAAKNAIGIEDFCKYKYIIYTEVRIMHPIHPFLLASDSYSSPGINCRLAHLLTKILGDHLLRSTPFPSSLRFNYSHTSTKLSPSHHPPHAPSILLVTALLLRFTIS